MLATTEYYFASEAIILSNYGYFKILKSWIITFVCTAYVN